MNNLTLSYDKSQVAAIYTDWHTLSEKMAIFDLETGNSHEFQICSMKDGHAEDEEVSLFGITDDGVKFGEPNIGTKTNMVWVNED